MFKQIYSSLILLLVVSCQAQNQKPPQNVDQPNSSQIDEYIVEMHEDKKGRLWFGTIGSGAAFFDGKKLSYLSEKDGLAGNTVAAIVEDKDGILWFGTHSGLSKYDGKTITNFYEKDGLCNDRVANLLIDKSGILWVGTWNGVCQFNGKNFTYFPIPKPEVETLSYRETGEWVTEIIEDSQGNIWFGRDGYGACKFDGKSFQHFTKKEGLVSNNVQAIQEDREGKIWIGSRVGERDHPKPEARKGGGGLNCFDGQKMIDFKEIKGLSQNDNFVIYLDKKGRVWISANFYGAYCYDGKSFQLYNKTDKEDINKKMFIQSILEDKNGMFWFGFSGGLFRLEGDKMMNITQNGPWL